MHKSPLTEFFLERKFPFVNIILYINNKIVYNKNAELLEF